MVVAGVVVAAGVVAAMVAVGEAARARHSRRLRAEEVVGVAATVVSCGANSA